jgi:hypothetical protein
MAAEVIDVLALLREKTEGPAPRGTLTTDLYYLTPLRIAT